MAAALFLLPAVLGAAPMQRVAVRSAMTQSFAPVAVRRGDVVMQSTQIAERTGNVLVFDVKDDYFASRDIFQQLYSYGNWAKLACVTRSTESAKKMLLSREARYSGLIDALKIIEAPDLSAVGGAQASEYDTWMLLNADEAQLSNHVRAAQDAGVRRLVITLNAAGSSLSNPSGMQSILDQSGITYTVIRTGELSKDVPTGAPMRIDSVDTPTCSELSREDAFRVAMEALTIPAAHNKMFSLCPAEDETVSVFKEMRFAGADRRQEVIALIKGAVEQRLLELKEQTAKEEAMASGKSTSDVTPEEDKAKKEEDVQAAFKRAQERAVRVAEEEAEKERLLDEKRKERAKTMEALEERIAAKQAEQGGGPVAEDSEKSPEAKKSDDDEDEDKKDGDDKDKPDEPPLATL
mmetsp:Transcript_15786/g.42445  ORF Transcript_15786/g.42445 Transcript_15786/m.42445 type:complete len:407 (+) Transcript_15786:53-1273(+)